MQQNKTASANEEMLRSGNYWTLAGKLCIPAILIMLVTVLYHMADVFFIGQTGDPNKVTAVTLASPMFSILSGLGVLLGTGGCTAISLALGKQDYSKIRQISAFCIWAAIGVGVVFSAVVLFLLEPVCRMLGADNATLQYTAEYLRILAIGAPVLMMTNVIPSLIRADGSTTNSMIGNLVGTVLNIVLDPLLILVFGMGAAGAALATVIANLLAAIYYFWFIVKKGRIYSVAPRDIILRKDVLLPVFSLGLPMSFSTILSSISGTIGNNLMMEYGSVLVAASSVAGRIGQLITMTVMGVCIGMQPAISYNYSARNIKRLCDILKKTTILAVAVGSVLALFGLIFRDQLLSAFLDDPDVLVTGRMCMLSSIVIGPFFGIYQICTTYLQSTGKSRQAILVSLMEKGLIYIPVLLLMKMAFGMYGVIFTGAVTNILSAAAALCFCQADFRKELKR